MTEMNLSLTHNGEEWIAKNESIAISGRTIAGLDDDVKKKLRPKGYKKGEVVKVTMSFDYQTIPLWMRQYAHYYLHRVVYIEF